MTVLNIIIWLLIGIATISVLCAFWLHHVETTQQEIERRRGSSRRRSIVEGV